MRRAGRVTTFEGADAKGDRVQSQTARALLALREMILGGELAPGERVSELSIAERTGISRTPIRAALQRLEVENLIEAIPSGGFSVKSFSTQDAFDAIEIRGVLEGLAARLAAERGPSPARMEPVLECLSELDELVATAPDAEGFSRYTAVNERLHALLVDLADSRTLKQQIERTSAFPFASPSSLVAAQAVMPEAFTILTVAQDQHRCVVEAISNREGARAQGIMQEHARLAARNLRLALRSEKALKRVPGGSLIRRAAL